MPLNYARFLDMATSYGLGWSPKASLRIFVKRAWRSGTHRE